MTATGTERLPLVSVLIPMRNEEHCIETCLQSLERQEYPRDRYEVLVLDGRSTDRSREVVETFSTANALQLRLLDNEGRTTARGLNLGLAEARGDIIVRVDAHATVAPDFLRQSVAALDESGAEGVGGPIESVAEGFVGQAIALAMSSPFGVGNAHFRYSREPRFTDTAAFAAYPRRLFDRVGFFNEEINYGEDDEFNYRLGDAGGRIFLTPRIRSTYYTRSSLPALFRQYLNYGRAKMEVLRLHPRQARLRQFVPAAFVGALLSLSALSLLGKRFRRMLAFVVCLYVAASLAASLLVGVRRGMRYVPLLPIAFACLHVAYGIGSLLGLAQSLTSWTPHSHSSETTS